MLHNSQQSKAGQCFNHPKKSVTVVVKLLLATAWEFTTIMFKIIITRGDYMKVNLQLKNGQ